MSGLRIPATISSEVITEPVEGGWCDDCTLPTVVALVVEVVTPAGRRLLLCVVCRACETGRSIPWT